MSPERRGEAGKEDGHTHTHTAGSHAHLEGLLDEGLLREAFVESLAGEGVVAVHAEEGGNGGPVHEFEQRTAHGTEQQAVAPPPAYNQPLPYGRNEAK